MSRHVEPPPTDAAEALREAHATLTALERYATRGHMTVGGPTHALRQIHQEAGRVKARIEPFITTTTEDAP